MTTPPVDCAYECMDCGHRWYYTKPICPECASDSIELYDLDTGIVESVTTVHATPGGVRSPNRLALVRFGEIGVVAQIAEDTTELDSGDRVRFAGEYVLRETRSGPITGPRLTTADIV